MKAQSTPSRTDDTRPNYVAIRRQRNRLALNLHDIPALFHPGDDRFAAALDLRIAEDAAGDGYAARERQAEWDDQERDAR
jgi:hypothetical protein